MIVVQQVLCDSRALRLPVTPDTHGRMMDMIAAECYVDSLSLIHISGGCPLYRRSQISLYEGGRTRGYQKLPGGRKQIPRHTYHTRGRPSYRHRLLLSAVAGTEICGAGILAWETILGAGNLHLRCEAAL